MLTEIYLPTAPPANIAASVSSCKMSHVKSVKCHTPRLSKMSLCSCVKIFHHLDATAQTKVVGFQGRPLIKWRNSKCHTVIHSHNYDQSQQSHEVNVAHHILCLCGSAATVMSSLGMAWEVGGGEGSVTVTDAHIPTPAITDTVVCTYIKYWERHYWNFSS